MTLPYVAPLQQITSTGWNTLVDEVNGLRAAYVSVTTYGAVGNGATNDTAAIQNTINAVSDAGGGVVFFPVGSYVIESPLVIPSFVSLVGAGLPDTAPEYGIGGSGFHSTIEHGFGTSFTMIQNADSTNGNAAIEIRNLRLQQMNETGSAPIIDFNKVRRSRIENCHLFGTYASTTQRALYVRNGSEHNAILNCHFDVAGITCENSNRTLVRECEIGHAGIYMVAGFANMVVDCDLYSDGPPSGITFGYPSMIAMNSVTGCLINGNQLTHARNHGIALQQGVKRSLIVNNEIKNSSQQTVNTWSGISLDSGAAQPTENNVISGNVCWDDTGLQAYGIQVVSFSGSQTNNNTFVGNVLTGNVSGPALQTAGLTNIWQANVGTTGQTVASAATITVPPGADLVTVTGTTNITSVTAGQSGQRVTLVFAGILTFTDGSNLKLSANFVTSADDTITMVCDGTNWYETARSVN